LIEAAIYGHEACVRVLIAAKADVALADKYGFTALHRAAISGRASICRVLIDEGALLTALDDEDRTPLEVAKAYNRAECVAILEAAAVEAAAAMGGAV